MVLWTLDVTFADVFNETIQINQTGFCWCREQILWKVQMHLAPLSAPVSGRALHVTLPAKITVLPTLPVLLTKILGISATCKVCFASGES